MKGKILAIIALLSLTTFIYAQNVGMDFGINFFKPSDPNFQTKNGSVFVIRWNIDQDISFGIVNETTNLLLGAIAGTLTATGISVQKSVVKNVAVGLNLCTATARIGAAVDTNPLIDIYGIVTLLSTKGDKVTGSLFTTISARFMEAPNVSPSGTLNGYNLTLGVSIGF